MSDKFWEQKTLSEMSPSEWESLCDGCGRCCLRALQDEDEGTIHYTAIACYLLDNETCRCTRYKVRKRYVPECHVLSKETPESDYAWMPQSCAYRRLHEGRGLADWHPLVSGNPDSVVQAGISVQGRTLPDNLVAEQQWPQFVITLVDC